MKAFEATCLLFETLQTAYDESAVLGHRFCLTHALVCLAAYAK
jgi:hypothetical protein